MKGNVMWLQCLFKYASWNGKTNFAGLAYPFDQFRVDGRLQLGIPVAFVLADLLEQLFREYHDRTQNSQGIINPTNYTQQFTFCGKGFQMVS